MSTILTPTACPDCGGPMLVRGGPSDPTCPDCTVVALAARTGLVLITPPDDGDPVVLPITGRSKRLIAAAHCDAEGAVIRIDDNAALDFWAEVRLDAPTLLMLWRQAVRLGNDRPTPA